MPRIIPLLVALLVLAGLIYFFSTRAAPVKQTVIETNVSNAATQ